jgi:hypothetical protein
MASRDIRRLKKKKEAEKKEKHNIATSTFSIIIIGLIIIGFLLSFFTGAFLPATKVSFGSYDGNEILWEYGNYFSRMVNSEYNRKDESLKQQLNEAQTPEEKEKIQKQLSEFSILSVIQSSFDAIVFHIAVLSETGKSGLKITDKRVQDVIAYYFWADLKKIENKEQRENKFADLISDHGDYVRETLLELQYQLDRRGLLISTKQLIKSVLFELQKYGHSGPVYPLPPDTLLYQSQYSWNFSNLLTSPKEIEFISEIAREYKKFDFFLLNYDEYPLDALLDYVNSNPENKGLFRTIDLSRIIFNGSESEAEELRNKIINGQTSFEEKAEKQSKEDEYAEDVIEQFTYYFYELVDIFKYYEQEDQKKQEASKVLTLKTGELSQPVKIDEEGQTWMIFRCEKEMTEPDFSTEKMQRAIMDYIKFKEKHIIHDYFEAKALEFKQKADSIGFKAACAQMGITYYTTNFFPLNFGLNEKREYEPLHFMDSAASSPENIKVLLGPALEKQEFFMKAFSLDVDEVSDPLLLENSIIILHCAAEQEIDKEKLETLKSTYSNYKSFMAFSDLHDLLTKEKKLDNRLQEGIEAYKKLRESSR